MGTGPLNGSSGDSLKCGTDRAGRVALPNVLVLVLNYNAGIDLEACLKSLQASSYPNLRIVVLDNGSSDGSREIPERLGIEFHAYGENLGYCAAYNRAFRGLGANVDLILLSNPDVVVPTPTVERMVRAAMREGSIGFIGPVQRHADTKDIRSAGIRWSCGHLPRHVRLPGEPLDALEGAFLLVRREVLEKVGGLDETLALNLEDLDWQLRARAAGFRSILAPDAEIYHRRPGPERVATGAYFQTRNVCLLTAKHCDPGAVRRLERRLRLEGIVSRILGRPRGRYILEGLRDFEAGVTGMKALA